MCCSHSRHHQCRSKQILAIDISVCWLRLLPGNYGFFSYVGRDLENWDTMMRLDER